MKTDTVTISQEARDRLAAEQLEAERKAFLAFVETLPTGAANNIRESMKRGESLSWDIWQASRSQRAVPRVVSNEAVNKALAIYNNAKHGDLIWKENCVRRMREVLTADRAALESIAPAQQEPVCWSLAHSKSPSAALFADCIYESEHDAKADAVEINGENGDLIPIPLYASPQPAQPSVPVMLTLQCGFQFPLVRSGDGFIIDPDYLQPQLHPSVPVGELKAFREKLKGARAANGAQLAKWRHELDQLIAAHDGKGAAHV